MERNKIIYGILALSIVVFLGYIIIENRINLNSFKDCKTILDRKNNIEIKNIEKSNDIPKKIIQCHKNIDIVPNYVTNNVKDKNPDWEYNFYDNSQQLKFLKEEYGQVFADKYKSFKKGAHKCDLFRVCWLYKYGGIYIDIDTEIIKPLDDIVKNVNHFTIMQNDMRGLYYNDIISNIFGVKHKTLINSFIITNRGNKYIKKCIEDIMKVDQNDLEKNYGAILFVMQHSLSENIEYQIFERPGNLFLPIKNRMVIYDKNNEKIGYSCYENYKNGNFIFK